MYACSNFYKSIHASFFKLTFSELQELNFKEMNNFVILATIAAIIILAAAAPNPQDQNELISKEAEIQSALEQALIKSALEDEDVAKLQNILAKVEHNFDSDKLSKAQLRSPNPNAHAQCWLWFCRQR